MTDFKKLYEGYGEYNILYNQLNMPSPSMEYAWRKTKKLIQDEVEGLIGNARSEISIADIGCGNGALLIRLAEFAKTTKSMVKFTGFEYSKPFVDYANKAVKFKKLTNISFKSLDIEHQDLPSLYDIIICSEVLEHLQKPKEFLEKVYASLKPKGCFILTTPNSKNLIKYPFSFLKNTVAQNDARDLAKYLTPEEQSYKLAELEQHLYVFGHTELKGVLTAVGFKNIKALRGTTLFGGPFLDNRTLVFALTIFFDWLVDLFPLPQMSWDNIFVCKKL